MEHEVLTADYHRNGVGGAGFYVGIVKSDGEQYLCVDFTGHPEDGEDYDPGRFAVLRMDLLRAGNIAMHQLTDPDTGQVIEGTGGNAWRGADHWGEPVSALIRDWNARSTEATLARLARERS